MPTGDTKVSSPLVTPKKVITGSGGMVAVGVLVTVGVGVTVEVKVIVGVRVNVAVRPLGESDYFLECFKCLFVHKSKD